MSLSVVIPMHNTRASLDELVRRLADVLPVGAELVLVDDACPQNSGSAAAAFSGRLPGGLVGRVVLLRPGVGQHSAVLVGLAYARGEIAVVMDADLQDAPEDVPTLVAALRLGRPDAVAAGRRGDYEAPGRQHTGRFYRQALSVLTAGAVPADAGMFSALTRPAVDAVLALRDPVAPLVPALARAGVPVRTVPLVRYPRRAGTSAMAGRMRVRVAARGLVTASPAYPMAVVLRRMRCDPPEVRVIELSGLGAGAVL